MSTKTSFSFTINSKPQSNRPQKPSSTFSDADADAAADDSSSKIYVTEFVPAEAPPPPESEIKPIAPIPNQWNPDKTLKNLPDLPQLSQSNGHSALEFVSDPGSKTTDNSDMGYGLNLRQPSAAANGVSVPDRSETISEMELRKLREDLESLPEETGMDEYTDVPVEGFGAALLSGYGWKEGRGIGRNAKEGVKVYEVTNKIGRGGLGFTGELPVNRGDGENL